MFRDPRKPGSAILSCVIGRRGFLEPMVCPYSTITGDIIPRGWDIPKIREVSRSSAQKKKKGRLNVGRDEDWGDSLESFSDALARTRYVCIGRDDPPTHSCWRSVVDDNGNPIFRNNICLEDRRLTSRRRWCVHVRIRVCVRMYALYEVFCSCRVTFLILPFHSSVTLRNRIEKNRNRRRCRDTDNYGDV